MSESMQATVPPPSAPSAEEFLSTVTEFVAAALAGDFDVPEVWQALARLSPTDNSQLVEGIDAGPPVPADGRPAPPPDCYRVLRDLAGFHAGLISAQRLKRMAAELVTRRSASPFATGFNFHVQHLLDPENPKYRLEEFVCVTPYQRLDVLERTTHLCCASRLHRSAGDLSEQPYDEVWNSDAAEAIRQSVLDGTYRYCNKSACPDIDAGNLTPKASLREDPWWARVIDEGIGKIDRPPARVNLAYDRQCNLACPSCRTGVIVTSDAVRERVDRITQRSILPLLRTVEEALITGSGDPFASRSFRRLLAWIDDENCPNLKIVLMTNGMLLTEAEWAKWPNLRGRIKRLKVSMDGASRETHELLRRRSQWDVMMRNLPFFGRLRAEGQIEAYELVFVVQRENFPEMGAFVDLARSVGASDVYFERITNWGTFSEGEYAEKAVFDPRHPLYDEFLEVMRDPRLRDPMVTLGSLASFAARD